jgi:large subunit ribosomal protein L15
MRLNEIKDKPGATRARKRLGRGVGSGLGKTGGRGVKGQKSRSGVAVKGFEGGQMPIHRRLPKRGFKNVFSKNFKEVNLDRVQAAVDSGALDAKQTVTIAALQAAGLVNKVHDGVRLLGRGELKAKLTFEVTGASAGAVKAVEAAGGSVQIVPLNGQSEAGAKTRKAPAKAEDAEAKPAKAQKKPKAED